MYQVIFVFLICVIDRYLYQVVLKVSPDVVDIRVFCCLFVVYIYKGASRRAALATRRFARRLHAMSSAVVVFAI